MRHLELEFVYIFQKSEGQLPPNRREGSVSFRITIISPVNGGRTLGYFRKYSDPNRWREERVR
jgi:hypothetical protein